MIELVTDDLPLAETTQGKDIKILGCGPVIEVSGAGNRQAQALVVRIRAPRPTETVDPKSFSHDAKLIFAWMVNFLPAGTMEKLREEIMAKGM